MTRPRTTLPPLDERIESRARATRETHAWWPCTKGCDLCCRSLPRLPTISAAEWERLRDALGALAPDVRAAIVARTHAAPASGPLTCPMLDAERGACLVYEARPIACRTYGFYTERDAGLHCNQVTRAIEEHSAAATVVWGNGEAIADDLRTYGPAVSLLDWITGSE